VARAAISPSAILSAGAGVGIGFWDHSIVLAVLLGAAAWAARMGLAVVARSRRRPSRLRTVDIDPWGVPEPWRQLVRDAVSARDRFDRMVADRPPGPARDRLQLLGRRVHQGADEVWALARVGAGLDAAAGAGIRSDALSQELRLVQAEKSSLAARPPGASELEALDRREAAIAAQLQAARRSEAARQRAADRLRVLTARLDEAVTSLVEMSLDTDATGLDGLDGSVGGVVDELTTLRKAMLEAGGTATTHRGQPRP